MSKITLKPGDYISTEGMAEEQYHAVAKAFMDAGAGKGEYFKGIRFERFELFGWSIYYQHLCHWDAPESFGLDVRELTIDQILATEPDQPMTIEQLLAKANKRAAKAQEHREKAAKHERKADEHEAKRVELVEQARQLMPGYTLEISAEWERDVEGQPTEDMTDPANWRAGDVVECVTRRALLTEGKSYKLRPTLSGATYDEDKDVCVINDDGGAIHYKARFFKWISRPQ